MVQLIEQVIFYFFQDVFSLVDKKYNGLDTDATLLKVSLVCIYSFTKSAQSISWAVSNILFLLGFGGETFIPGEDPGRAESWGQANQFHSQKSNRSPVCRGGEVCWKLCSSKVENSEEKTRRLRIRSSAEFLYSMTCVVICSHRRSPLSHFYRVSYRYFWRRDS